MLPLPSGRGNLAHAALRCSCSGFALVMVEAAGVEPVINTENTQVTENENT